MTVAVPVRARGRLESALRAQRSAGRKVLVPYIMAGMIADWVEAVHAVAEAGADAVEIGIPFSDPMMDGPVIEEAAVAALRAGTTPHGVLSAIERARFTVPVAVMTYYNIFLRTGHRRMARSMIRSGVAAAIVPDLPLEEIEDWAREADAVGIETVLLVAPSTPGGRVERICARSRGFVYAVSRMGTTGERAALSGDLHSVVERVRSCTDLPVCAGVGISTPEQATEACRFADGVVVGSALVRRLLAGGGPEAAGELVAQLRDALDAG